jgi:hypothetical protein
MSRVQDLIDAAKANPGKAREYALQILALTEKDAVGDRAQMRPRIGDLHHPPALQPVVEPQLAPSRWIELTGIPWLNPQGEWASGRIQFQFSPGFLIGWKGTAVHEVVNAETQAVIGWDSTLGDMRAAGVKLQFNGGEPLVTDGQAETWQWYSDVFANTDSHTPPILRRVEQSDTLNVMLRNDYPATAVRLLLSLSFRYLSDRDLPELLGAVAR